MAENDQQSAEPKKHRSPAYPFISLRRAVERAHEFYSAERRHAAPVSSATKAWKFSDKSSGGQQTVAALKQYGLMADEGVGDDRRVRLTELALAILLDEVPDSQDRARSLTTAALSPKLFADMYARWATDLPSDETIRTYLRRDKGYNDDVLGVILKAYKDTLSYAKVTRPDKIDDADGDDANPDRPVVGDFVQWESQGALHFLAPKRLIRVSDDGSHGFVEGESTGLPMEQLQKADPPPAPPIRGAASVTLGEMTSRATGTVGGPHEVSSLPEGQAILQWPANISLESVDELEDWLKLVVKKMRRRYTTKPAEGGDA